MPGAQGEASSTLQRCIPGLDVPRNEGLICSMATSRDELRNQKRDYFIARSENGELIMEPHCYCGSVLEAEYYCNECNHKCSCTFIACADPEAFSLAEKLIHGTDDFGKFEAAELKD